MNDHKSIFQIPDYRTYYRQSADLLAARAGFFTALRSYLRPTPPTEAARMGDRLASAPARFIADEHWVENAARGYVMVLEDPEAGRTFKLQVVQQGFLLRISLIFQAWHPPRLCHDVFADSVPALQENTDGTHQLHWIFEIPALYADIQAMEGALYRIGAVYEAALQATVPTSKEKLQ